MIESLLFTLASHHFNPTREYNEVNPGVIVELNNGFVIGGYRNSLGRPTALAGYRSPSLRAGPVSVNLLGGVCSGYRAPVCGCVSLSYHNLVIHYVPKIGDYNSHTIGISWRMKL